MRDAGDNGLRHMLGLHHGLQRRTLRDLLQRLAAASGDEIRIVLAVNANAQTRIDALAIGQRRVFVVLGAQDREAIDEIG